MSNQRSRGGKGAACSPRLPPRWIANGGMRFAFPPYRCPVQVAR
jgi:hypothetical protein